MQVAFLNRGVGVDLTERVSSEHRYEEAGGVCCVAGPEERVSGQKEQPGQRP